MQRKMMMTFLVGAVFATAGCTQQIIGQKEDMLAAAGFRIQPANTPERIQSLQTLPPNRFVQEQLHGQEVWVYADPIVCRCLYVGTPQNYQYYHQLNFQQNIANENLEAAQMNQFAGFGWGPWGGFGF